MRLLRYSKTRHRLPDGGWSDWSLDVEFKEFPADEHPPYAITSHRWTDDELTYDDIVQGTGRQKKGWKKLEGFCEVVMKMGCNPAIQYVWIDTCCINKANLTELSEALNSMYRWYSEASVCLAWLHDVEQRNSFHLLSQSEWFRRGWTLQELVAPSLVIFYTASWEILGHKATDPMVMPARVILPWEMIGPPLNDQVTRITGIPSDVLWDFRRAENLSFEVRESWMKGRQTTRFEDMAYCQLGLYGVFLNPRYGERGEAYERLLKKIEKKRLKKNVPSLPIVQDPNPPSTRFSDDYKHAEPLIAAFKVRQQGFFRFGRVFLTLWSEPAGASANIFTYHPTSTFSVGQYGEKVFSKVRRMVVVRTSTGFCNALPIVTYGNQGVGKHGLDKSEHAIIHSTKEPPVPLQNEVPQRNETGMRSPAIRVEPDDRQDFLSPMSRVNFGAVHTVYYNVKVKSLGMVHKDSLKALESHFQAVMCSSKKTTIDA